MKVEKATLKLFLTSGITVTVGNDEKVMDMEHNELDLYTLGSLIKQAIENKKNLEFVAEIKHPYKDEKGKMLEQEIKHYYNVPSDRISWFMIEEV